MSNEPVLSPNEMYHPLKEAAKRAAKKEGYEIEPHPGGGQSNVWRLTRNGEELWASIRTSCKREVGFESLKDGWKTLDDADVDVDVVIVAAVDDEDNHEKVEVFIFEADEVRERFDANRKAREENNGVVKDNFDIRISLDQDNRIPYGVGSGLADIHDPKAVYSVSELKSGRTRITTSDNV